LERSPNEFSHLVQIDDPALALSQLLNVLRDLWDEDILRFEFLAVMHPNGQLVELHDRQDKAVLMAPMAMDDNTGEGIPGFTVYEIPDLAVHFKMAVPAALAAFSDSLAAFSNRWRHRRDPENAPERDPENARVLPKSGAPQEGIIRCHSVPSHATQLHATIEAGENNSFWAVDIPFGGRGIMAGLNYDRGERQNIWDAIVRRLESRVGTATSIFEEFATIRYPDQGEDFHRALTLCREGRWTEIHADFGEFWEWQDTRVSSTGFENRSSGTEVRESTASTNPAPPPSEESPTGALEGPPQEQWSEPKTGDSASALPLGERLDLIERLGSLKDRGHLSPEEFSEQKTQLIYG